MLRKALHGGKPDTCWLDPSKPYERQLVSSLGSCQTVRRPFLSTLAQRTLLSEHPMHQSWSTPPSLLHHIISGLLSCCTSCAVMHFDVPSISTSSLNSNILLCTHWHWPGVGDCRPHCTPSRRTGLRADRALLTKLSRHRQKSMIQFESHISWWKWLLRNFFPSAICMKHLCSALLLQGAQWKRVWLWTILEAILLCTDISRKVTMKRVRPTVCLKHSDVCAGSSCLRMIITWHSRMTAEPRGYTGIFTASLSLPITRMIEHTHVTPAHWNYF